MAAGFIEERFPLGVAFGATGGPERRTSVVTLGSGAEARNSRWAHARRRFDAGTGVRSVADLRAVIAFFEMARGQLYGFRFQDPFDSSSAPSGAAPGPFDTGIGIGDGTTATFQLSKTYGIGAHAYRRTIVKPVLGTVRVAVAGVETAASDFWVDVTTGRVTFSAMAVPTPGAGVTAGFLFDVPVRFDTDRLEANLTHFEAGRVPSIPLIEIRV